MSGSITVSAGNRRGRARASVPMPPPIAQVSAGGFVQGNQAMRAWDAQNARFQAQDDRERADAADAAMRRGVENALISSKDPSQGSATGAGALAGVSAGGGGAAPAPAPAEDDGPLEMPAGGGDYGPQLAPVQIGVPPAGPQEMGEDRGAPPVPGMTPPPAMAGGEFQAKMGEGAAPDLAMDAPEIQGKQGASALAGVSTGGPVAFNGMDSAGLRPGSVPSIFAPGAGGPDPSFRTALRRQESGGNDLARNPRSSATGRYQFIDSTWRAFSRARPDLFAGMSPQQIMDARLRPDFQEQGLDWLANENHRALSGMGIQATNTNLALAHGFGAAGAARLLRADPNTPIEQVFDERVLTANPNLRGQTVGQVVQGFSGRFGGGMPQMAGGGAGQPQRVQMDHPFRAILAEMVRAPGTGQAAMNLLMQGQRMVNQDNQWQRRADMQQQLQQQRMDLQQQRISAQGGRADARERMQAERNAMTALGRGDMEVFQYWSQRAGINLPPNVVQNAQARRQLAAGSLLARRFYNDRDQAQTFFRTYMQTGSSEQAFQAAGAPRGADPRFSYRWIQDGEREVLTALDPTGRTAPQPVVPGQPLQRGGAQPAAPAEPGAAPPTGAPALQQTTTQPISRPMRGQGTTGRTPDRTLRYQYAIQAGLSEQEAAAVASGVALNTESLVRAYTRVQASVSNDPSLRANQREAEIDRRMGVISPDWRQRIQGQRAAPPAQQPGGATTAPPAGGQQQPAPGGAQMPRPAPTTAPNLQGTVPPMRFRGPDPASGQMVDWVLTGDRTPDGRPIYVSPSGARRSPPRQQ